MKSILQENCKNAVALCVSRLITTQTSIAFAESATAGFASGYFAMVERAGEVLKGGVVCYDACVKKDMLQVSKALIERHTAESEEVTQAIASGVAKLMEADMTVGITGLLREGGSETAQKPVGTVFIAITRNGSVVLSKKFWFPGDEWEILFQTVRAVAESIMDVLKNNNAFELKRVPQIV